MDTYSTNLRFEHYERMSSEQQHAHAARVKGYLDNLLDIYNYRHSHLDHVMIFGEGTTMYPSHEPRRGGGLAWVRGYNVPVSSLSR